MKKLVLLIVCCMILCACEVEHLTYEEAQQRRFIEQSGTPLEEMLDVGEEMQVKKVAKGDEYSVLYEAKNGDLEWLELSDYKYNLTIKESDKGYSYLARGTNNVAKVTFTEADYIPVGKPFVTLYLHVEELNDSTYTKSCGKNCTEEVPVTVFE